MKETCLILGASGDIGSAITEQLAAEGYQLILHYYRNKSSIDALIDCLPSDAVLDCIEGDFSNGAGIKQFIKKVKFAVDNVIFASGETYYGIFQDTDELVMERLICQHVKAPMMVTKDLLPAMITRKRGNIVLISSIWGEVGASCEVVYSSVKGAQNSFVRALAKETAQSGVSVNGVSPGFIDTKLNSTFSKEEQQAIIDEIPLRRAGKPKEIADAVLFLLSKRSSYIQGEIINVTGAW